jgi:hypothetical protein
MSLSRPVSGIPDGGARKAFGSAFDRATNLLSHARCPSHHHQPGFTSPGATSLAALPAGQHRLAFGSDFRNNLQGFVAPGGDFHRVMPALGPETRMQSGLVPIFETNA